MNFLLRLVLLIAGLVVAASLAVVLVALLAAWGLRAAWARLTGRPIAPFVARVHPFDRFDQMRRRAPRAGAARKAGAAADVTDVEPRPPSS